MVVDYFDAPARARLGTRSLARALGSIDRARAAGHTCKRLINMSDAELTGRGHGKGWRRRSAHSSVFPAAIYARSRQPGASHQHCQLGSRHRQR